ncbi:transcription regulator hth lysr [Trichococcus palustris]|jgi:DNA-binding transcriptional LysR family regulator|uniref:Transcription regulator hth lysr n=1 Tax=Trichococcus palustris TaxID=140314 RepID=A0A143YBE4_9LACT|nr:LysR family transcriptional regulator [Trichococcus palustris]CZQ86573.1 transcription regulator hth lysr [Trichococcus palustris]SFK81093.1 DNA-binding transcriptional regulator, LysR family [Trichococcus palustris]
MDIKKWETLLKVVEVGSFSKACEELGYTQSGLTHMMNSLEKEVGFPVLQRGHYGVRLTENGERIIPAVKEVILADNKLMREINQINAEENGTIRISAYTSIAVQWLPAIVVGFAKEYPNINVEIFNGGVTDTYNLLETGKVNLTFGSFQANSNFKWIPLKYDRMLAILPADYDTKGLDYFPVTGYEGKSFLMPSYGFSFDIMRVINGNNVKPNIKETSLDDPAIIAMVEGGWGISMLSELVMQGQNSKVLALPLAPAAVRELGIALPKDTTISPVIKKFIAYAQKIIGSL